MPVKTAVGAADDGRPRKWETPKGSSGKKSKERGYSQEKKLTRKEENMHKPPKSSKDFPKEENKGYTHREASSFGKKDKKDWYDKPYRVVPLKKKTMDDIKPKKDDGKKRGKK